MPPASASPSDPSATSGSTSRWERPGRDWVLLLDRDGVVNRRVVGDYVRSWSQFEFLPGSLDAVRALAGWAPYVVVVTNQQGVGKGLMSRDALDDVHARMVREVEAAGGRIDAVLVCPHLASDFCGCRKPGTKLVQDWLDARPHLDVRTSVMVGDSVSDMIMGRALGVGQCVWIGEGRPAAAGVAARDHYYDMAYSSLRAFADDVVSSLHSQELV